MSMNRRQCMFTASRMRKLFIASLVGTASLTHLAAQAIEGLGWHLGDANSERAAPASIGTYKTSPGPHTVYVAVIDSGIIQNHPSLEGALVGGFDMISSNAIASHTRSTDFSPDPRDAQCGAKLVSSTFRTHGTEVASIIAANGKDGMLGVNPKAKIVPIKVFGVCGLNMGDLIAAMNWAAGLKVDNLPINPNPVKIINISISGGKAVCSPALQQAINRLVNRNIFIVVAAGNNFNKPLAEPANCNGVISVGSVSADNQIERHSALDPRTVIYAPGGGARLKIDSGWAVNKIRIATFEPTVLGGEKSSVKESAVGTSYAAPIVAGYLSLWLSYHPNKTPQEWFAEIKAVQRPVPTPPTCPQCNASSLTADLRSMR